MTPYLIWQTRVVAENSVMNTNSIYVPANQNRHIPDHLIKKILEKEHGKKVVMMSEVQAQSRKNAILIAISPLYMLILSVIYIILIANNNHITGGEKTFWIIAIFIGGAFIMPVYWFNYIWKRAKGPPPLR